MHTDNEISDDMYAKLFAQVAQSSLTQNETISTRGVFFMLLAIADMEGVVLGTDAAIARIINVTGDVLEGALGRLMAPDPDSQSPDEDGRRVVRLEETPGLLIVNYLKYRGLKNNAERREYFARKQRESRRRRAANSSANQGGSVEPRPEPQSAPSGQPGGNPGHSGAESGPAEPPTKKTSPGPGTGGRRNRPSSIEECIEMGKMLNITELVCRDFWLKHDARAEEGADGAVVWMTGGENNRVPVGNWVSLLKAWNENERHFIGKRGRSRVGKTEQPDVVSPAGAAIDVSKTRVTKPQPQPTHG